MQITMSGEKNDNILRCFKKPNGVLLYVSLRLIYANVSFCERQELVLFIKAKTNCQDIFKFEKADSITAYLLKIYPQWQLKKLNKTKIELHLL